MNWTFILCSAFAIVFFGGGWWLTRRAFERFHQLQELQQKGLTATGIVADIKSEGFSDGAPTYTFTVVFTIGAGETRRRIFRNSHVKPGLEQQVPLIYHPDQPEKAEILPLHPVAELLFPLVAGLLSIGCGLACLITLFFI